MFLNLISFPQQSLSVGHLWCDHNRESGRDYPSCNIRMGRSQGQPTDLRDWCPINTWPCQCLSKPGTSVHCFSLLPRLFSNSSILATTNGTKTKIQYSSAPIYKLQNRPVHLRVFTGLHPYQTAKISYVCKNDFPFYHMKLWSPIFSYI